MTLLKADGTHEQRSEALGPHLHLLYRHKLHEPTDDRAGPSLFANVNLLHIQRVCVRMLLHLHYLPHTDVQAGDVNGCVLIGCCRLAATSLGTFLWLRLTFVGLPASLPCCTNQRREGNVREDETRDVTQERWGDENLMVSMHGVTKQCIIKSQPGGRNLH